MLWYIVEKNKGNINITYSKGNGFTSEVTIGNTTKTYNSKDFYTIYS